MARITPPHLGLALDRVKAYVAKHPRGVDVKDLMKVEAYTFLNKKAREQLLEIIENYNQLIVTRTGGKRGNVWLRHKRHVEEEQQQKLNARVEAEIPQPPAEPVLICIDCLKEKPATEFKDSKINLCGQCRDRPKAPAVKKAPEHLKLNCEVKKQEKVTMAPKTTLTALELRKQAEALWRQAEEAERVSTAKDIFQKRLDPLRREVLLAHTKVTKGFEAMVDGMDELDKAMTKLRNFKVEV